MNTYLLTFWALLMPAILEFLVCTLLLLAYLLLRPNAKVRNNIGRFLLLWALSILGSVSCGFESVIVSAYFLPLSDGAYGLGVRILEDPFVLEGVLLGSLPIGFALSPYYFNSVHGKNLSRSVPFVQCVAMVVVGLISVLHPFLAMLGGTLAVILCLEYLRTRKSGFFSTISAT
jgi:hypothetical protein